MHVWGCPVYVLSPILQSGNKIPHWEPRSKLGVFCGLSTIHSSEVPQVLNQTTGGITTQFHVVFNDLFSTVPSVEREEEPLSHWNNLYLEQTEFVPIDTPPPLSSELLSESDNAQSGRTTIRANRVRNNLNRTNQNQDHNDPLFLPNPNTSVQFAGVASSERASTIPPSEEAVALVTEGGSTMHTLEGDRQSGPHQPTPITTDGLRRSARSNKGQYNSTR